MLVVFIVIALTSHVASAQASTETQPPQSATNGDVAVAVFSKNANGRSTGKPGGDTSPTERLESQLKKQQDELDAMKERVLKLEAMLTAYAGNKPRAERPVPADPLEADSYGYERIRGKSVAADTPRELLPSIGQIGAEVNLLVGGAQNPYKSNAGFFGGGSINLPLLKLPGGKLSYEIMVTLQRSKTDIQVTSPVFALVNSALNSALGTPASVNNLFGPLPITNPAVERSTVLTVVPVTFKYTLTKLDRYRFRPYIVAGLGTYVSLSTQNLTQFNANRFVAIPSVANLLNTLLQGPLIGGLAPAAPELRARGIGQGQGDVRFGLNIGGGVEFRVTRRTSFGVDYRVNKIEGRNSTYSTLAFKQGFHF